MAWNTRPQGVGPTEGNISFSGGISPRFQTGNATSDAVQQAIAAIAQILRQRQQDKIANQLLAVDNARPAVAVDGTQKGTGQPDTQLTDAMVKQNLSLTNPDTGQPFPTQPGRVPDRGGVEGLQWADLIRKRLSDQEGTDLKQELLRARIDRLQHPVLRGHAVTDGGDGTSSTEPHTWTGPDGSVWAIGPKGGMKPLTHPPKSPTTSKIESSLATSLSPLAETPETFGKIQGEPDMVTFWSPDYQKKLSTDEAAKTDKAVAVLPNKIAVPYTKYKGLQDRFNAVQAYKEATGSQQSDETAQVDSKVARAQQAINDPEATPQEKAQAQKILTAAGL